VRLLAGIRHARVQKAAHGSVEYDRSLTGLVQVLGHALGSTLHMTSFAYGLSAREGRQNPSDFSNIDVSLRHLKSHQASFRLPKNARRCNY
jgi:hypothetical protein